MEEEVRVGKLIGCVPVVMTTSASRIHAEAKSSKSLNQEQLVFQNRIFLIWIFNIRKIAHSFRV